MIAARTKVYLGCTEDLARGVEHIWEAEEGCIVVNCAKMGVYPMMRLLDGCGIPWCQPNLSETMSRGLYSIEDVFRLQCHV